MLQPQDDDDEIDTLLTVRDWLRYGTSRFAASGLVFGQGTTTAQDEAAFLILETLHLPVDVLEPWSDARLTRAERQAVFDILERRISTRSPASYLTGSAYIQGHRFAVDERVIVPRSYIGELLCTGGLTRLPPEDRPVGRILDLCTGSGALAILAALQFPDAEIDATDLSTEALEVARRNVADYGLCARIALHCGDLFVPIAERRYDLILANPPYVPAQRVGAFPPEFAAEPVLAHLGGPDGLDIVRRVITEVPARLASGGILVVEVGAARGALEREFPRLPFLWLDTAASEGEVFALSTADFAESTRTRPPSRTGRTRS